MSTPLRQRLIGGFILFRSVVYGGLSYVVPKRRGLIVFYPAFEPRQYGGNLCPLFEAMVLAAPAGRRLVWLTQSRTVANRLRTERRRVSRTIWRPVWMLLRAEWIVLDKNEPRIGLGRFRMIQLWHGSGFKRIALETPNLSASRLRAMRWHFGHYALIVANSEEDRARKAHCFDNRNVAVLGSPRNDALFSAETGRALRGRLDLEHGRRIVSYCPTFRDIRTSPAFTAGGWRALDQAMGRTNTVLVVKRHRFDTALEVPQGLINVRDVTALVGDTAELLAITDVLISDYSSIATDFVLTGRPVLFYTYDADAYQARQQRLYYDLFTTLPGPFVEKETALIEALADLSWFDAPDHQSRYRSFQRMFHARRDAGSTARVAQAVERLIGGDGAPARKDDRR